MPRRRVLIPASAHGTNPASAALCGYDGDRGAGRRARPPRRRAPSRRSMDEIVAALMVTNPNTLGLFEEEIEARRRGRPRAGRARLHGRRQHERLMGVAQARRHGRRRHAVQPAQDVLDAARRRRPGRGPGRGARAARRVPARAAPRAARTSGSRWSDDAPKSVGRVRSFYGNFGILVRAYAYIARLGGPGLAEATRLAVLNANYLRARLRGRLPPAVRRRRRCTSACSRTATCRPHDVQTLDVAKRLLDYGFYAPTIYFPLVVKGALMIEPTETETQGDARRVRRRHARASPRRRGPTRQLVRDGAARDAASARLDETRAARRPILRWRPAGARRACERNTDDAARFVDFPRTGV